MSEKVLVEHKRVFKFRIYPTKEQESFLTQNCDASTIAYNSALGYLKDYHEPLTKQWKEHCEKEGVEMKYHEYLKMVNKPKLTAYDAKKWFNNDFKKKEGNEWFNEIITAGTANSILDLDKAFKNFFRGAGYPKFKQVRRFPKAFRVERNIKTDTGAKLHIKDRRLELPKFKKIFKNYLIKTKVSKLDTRVGDKYYSLEDGVTKSFTVSATSTGKWFVAINVTYLLPEVKPKTFNKDNSIGIDAGLEDLLVLDNGTKIKNAKHLKKQEKRLRINSKRLSRKKLGSKNWKKQVKINARIHEKIANRRSDFAHKATHELAYNDSYNAFMMEDLDLKEMGTKKGYRGKSVADAGLGEIRRQIEYKAGWAGKTVIKVDRYFPSSKTCNCCGYVVDKMPVKKRHWICPKCGTRLDRDINAAINVKNKGLEEAKSKKATENKKKKALKKA